ncbi:MAG: carboxypeptidase-like regulatory domain-containing protein, partial [Planctomycetota bacterium]
MKVHLSCKSCLTAFALMAVLSLAAGTVNSATTNVTYRVSAVADDGYAIIPNKGIQDTKGSSLISSLQAEEGYSTFFTEDATYPNGDGWAWDQGQQTLDGNSLYIGTNNRDYFVPYPVSAMRFSMLGIFRGMDVISANFRIYTGDEMNDGRVYGVIHGGLPGWPYVFEDISLIEKTQASADWDHIDAWQSNSWYYSPDLTNIVQELINKPDWKAGHPMTMVYSTSQKSPYTRSFLSSENGYDLAPKLKIRFRACVIFGYVRTAEGEPIKFATIDDGEYLEQRTTSSDGSYQFFVPPGWSGTLTVSKDDIVFKPAQYTYTNLNTHMYEQNFIEYKPKVSGFINDKYGYGLEQASVSADNGGASGFTDANGFYEILVPFNWSGTVTAYKSGWRITPYGISYNNLVTDQNDQNYSAYQPTISGHAKDTEGILPPGVTIDVQGIETLLTDANGYYRIDVPYKWTGRITPGMTGWGFVPSYRHYAILTIDRISQDFTAFQPEISGYVLKADGGGMEGTAVTANNGGGSSVTNSSGYYEITVPYNWSGMVSVSKVGYVFIPPNRTYSNLTGNWSNQNYTEFQPVISGYVKDDSGTGVEGVSVSADNSGGSDTTDATGYYEVSVPYNWSGTLTPAKTGWGFNPASQTYSNVISDRTVGDYIGLQPKISGHITDSNGFGVEGVLVSADNGGEAVVTDANGHYSITVPYDWSGTVIPGKTGWHITPLSRSYSNVITNQTNQDYTAFQPKISGYVTDSNGIGVEGIMVSADNGGSDTTDPNGYYKVTVPYGFSGTVTAYRPAWEITPVNRVYSNIVDDQTDQNFSATYTGIITVKADGSGDVATIQAAIDGAVNGDVVVLQAGIYTGSGNRDIDFLGKV